MIKVGDGELKVDGTGADLMSEFAMLVNRLFAEVPAEIFAAAVMAGLMDKDIPEEKTKDFIKCISIFNGYKK